MPNPITVTISLTDHDNALTVKRSFETLDVDLHRAKIIELAEGLSTTLAIARSQVGEKCSCCMHLSGRLISGVIESAPCPVCGRMCFLKFGQSFHNKRECNAS